MSVTVPTTSSIKMRFPEFASVSDPVIEFAIEEARPEVNDSWTANYNIALLYLVAHYVSCSVARAASAGDGNSGEIASESIGRLSITYRAPTLPAGSDAAADDKSTTSYGRRYLDILSANFSGPLIV